MSTMPNLSSRTLWQRWTGFWFTPQDPITLGFIRVVTGLLILYTHLAYSLDLQAFFGKHAWWSSEASERARKEQPWYIGDFWSWKGEQTGPHLPDFPHRRQAVMEFIRTTADKSPAERARALRLLNRLAADETGVSSAATFNYLGQLGTLDRTWDASLYFLLNEKWPAVAPTEPEPLRIYPPPQWVSPTFKHEGPDGRLAVADEIRTFRDLLPKESDSRKYVMNHLLELNPPQLKALASFLNTLPDDPAERNRIIDFLEYWNADPRLSYRQGTPVFSVWFHVTDPTEMAVLHGLFLIVLLLFTIGCFTRVTSVLTWLITISYIQRGQQVLFGQDVMMNILVIYLMVGNSGAALSVDRLIARYRAVRACLRRSGAIDPATRAFLNGHPLSTGAGFGIRLIQIHFCFIYLASGLSKLLGHAWWNGTAFWDVMVNPEFTLMRYQMYEKLVRGWASVKPLYYLIIMIGVWFTLALEISFAFLIWTRWRPVLLWAGVLLHASIGVLMGLNLFELLMMVMLLAYFPPFVVRDRLRGGPDLPTLGYGFDAANAASAHAAALVAAVDVENQAALEPKPGLKQPALVAAGVPITGTDPVNALFGSLRLLRPFKWVLWVPGVKGLFTRLLFPAK